MDFKMEFKFTSKPNLPLLIVSVILFIMVLLPWATVSVVGFNASASGAHDWGILTLIMSLVGIGLAFVSVQKTRAILSIGAGILALLGVVIYWATYLSGASIGFGLIIALIASLGLIVVGYMDYRKWKGPAAPNQPPASPRSPLAPPPPPAPPSPPPIPPAPTPRQ